MTYDDMARAIVELQGRVEKIEARLGPEQTAQAASAVASSGDVATGGGAGTAGTDPTHREVVFLDANNVPTVRVLPESEIVDRIGEYARTDEPDEQNRLVYRYAG